MDIYKVLIYVLSYILSLILKDNPVLFNVQITFNIQRITINYPHHSYLAKLTDNSRLSAKIVPNTFRLFALNPQSVKNKINKIVYWHGALSIL